MKKLFFPVAIVGAMMVTFASCNKDKDNNVNNNVNNDPATLDITASVVNADDASLVKHVAAFSYDSLTHQTIASTSFSNGGFSITFSDSIPDAKYMYKPFEGAEQIPTLTISDTNAKIADISLHGFSSESGEFNYNNGDYQGYFICYASEIIENTVANESYAFITYIDSDFTISGSYSYPINGTTLKKVYNISSKKGWNVLYKTIEANYSNGELLLTITLSSTPVSGLKWYFEPVSFGDDDMTTASPAKKKFQKIKLQKKAEKGQRFAKI